MSKTAKIQHDIPLSDVMLAMDIADTIRHRDKIVERELSEEAREKALFNKVKATYASQGIEVSDATIREAIAAVEDERFAYKPPKKSLFTKFAHIYINRARWGKSLIGLFAIIGLMWAIIWAAFTLPKKVELDKQASALNQSIEKANSSEESLQLRLKNLINELNQAEAPSQSNLASLFQQQKTTAFSRLKNAGTYLENAKPLKQEDNFDSDNIDELALQANSQLTQQNKQLDLAEKSLDDAELSIKHLYQLKTLPNELFNLRQQAISISQEHKANESAQRLYSNGIAAIQGLDFLTANNATSELKNLIERLQSSYEIVIVSRHGERTGIWREPEINRSARNYYIIVEAIKNGKAIRLPIVNEENGKVERVKKWGLRVQKSVYDQIARDKQDDGIVQNKSFGYKKVGYLEVDYKIPTNGNAITRW